MSSSLSSIPTLSRGSNGRDLAWHDELFFSLNIIPAFQKRMYSANNSFDDFSYKNVWCDVILVFWRCVTCRKTTAGSKYKTGMMKKSNYFLHSVRDLKYRNIIIISYETENFKISKFQNWITIWIKLSRCWTVLWAWLTLDHKYGDAIPTMRAWLTSDLKCGYPNIESLTHLRSQMRLSQHWEPDSPPISNAVIPTLRAWLTSDLNIKRLIHLRSQMRLSQHREPSWLTSDHKCDDDPNNENRNNDRHSVWPVVCGDLLLRHLPSNQWLFQFEHLRYFWSNQIFHVCLISIWRNLNRVNNVKQY